MTYSVFDIALPIALGCMFGVIRYFEWQKTTPENAARLAARDALTGILGMGAMTVIMKYFGIL